MTKATNYLLDKARETIKDNPDINMVKVKDIPNYCIIKSIEDAPDSGFFVDVIEVNDQRYIIWQKII